MPRRLLQRGVQPDGVLGLPTGLIQFTSSIQQRVCVPRVRPERCGARRFQQKHRMQVQCGLRGRVRRIMRGLPGWQVCFT